MAGDEVQQGPWGVDGRRAAVPTCAWYAFVIVSDSGGLLLLCAALVEGLVIVRAGSGVLVLEGLVRLVDILGSCHRAPCLRSAGAEVCFEDAARWPSQVGEERGVVGSSLGHDSHWHGDDANNGDVGPHKT